VLVTALAQSLAPGTDRQVELDIRIDITEHLPRIAAPTLLIASTWDEVVPAAQQQALRAAIADAGITEIDAGHGAPAEDPETFTDLLINFIGDQEHRLPRRPN
jgi:pimeloyl-ACP methyl ester carboxylesterase